MRRFRFRDIADRYKIKTVFLVALPAWVYTCFGKVTDIIGFSKSFLILLVCMALFYVCYLLLQKIVKRN